MATIPKSISVESEFPFPDEILTDIISYVPMSQWACLEYINHPFQRNAFDNWLKVENIRFDQDLAFDREKLRLDAPRVLNSLLVKLIECAPYIRSFGGFTIFQIDDSLHIINADFIRLSQFQFLKNIDFSNIRISYVELANFLATSTIRGRLKNLKLINCLPVSYSNNDDQLLRAAFDDIPNIPPLQLEEFSFAGLGADFGFFETINISNLTTLKIMDIVCVPIKIAPLIHRCHVNLRHLEFSLFFVDYNETPFLNHIQNQISPAFDLLTAVNTCRNLSILKVNQILENPTIDSNFYLNTLCLLLLPNQNFKLGQSSRLKQFSLLDRQFYDNNVIQAISLFLNNLTLLEIYVDYCSADHLIDLISKLPRLRKFRLMIKNKTKIIITPEVVKALVATSQDLEYLHLGNPPIYPNMETDLAQLNNKIKGLSFEGQKDIGALSPWINVFGPKLESFELKGYGCQDIEYGFFITKTPKLRFLSLDGCSISDAVFNEIALRCPYLEEISVNFDSALCSVSISGVQAIIDGCQKLKRLVGFDWISRDELNFGKYRGVALV